MELDALREAWHRQPGRAIPTRTIDQDVASAMERGQAIARRVRFRDGLETGVCLLLFPFLVMTVLTDEYPLVRAGAVVMALACVLIPIRLRMARKMAPEVGLPVVETLQQEVGYLTSQERLLRTTVWWYFLPLLVGVVLMILGPPGAPLRKAVMIGGASVLYGVLFRANWRASKVAYAARRDEVEELLRGLAALERDADSGQEAEPESR